MTASSSPWIKDVSTAEFPAAVLARSREVPVVVDFWAAWCGPCHMMAPQFEQAAARLKGKALLAKVNSDENPQTAARFGIRSIPTMVMLEGGREVRRQTGATQAAQIVAWAGGAG